MDEEDEEEEEENQGGALDNPCHGGGEGWRLGQDGGFGGHQAGGEVQVREVATEDLQSLNFLGHYYASTQSL